jgi:hypothetical protein
MHAPTHPNGHTQTPTPAPGATPAAAEAQRDAQGHFAEGNRGGPGNPFARQVAALRAGLLARLTPEDLGDIAEALVREAKEGNVAAAKLLLSYTLGKPAQAADGADGQLRQSAEEANARQAEKAVAPPAAPPSAPPRPPLSEEALARVGKLLGLTPPSPNGISAQPAGVKPPSANGGAAAEAPWRLVPPPSANGGAPKDQRRD